MRKQLSECAEEDYASRRNAVLEAAGRVFISKGYEGATTLDIATEAKVSKRMLYALFGNKQGILEALIKTVAQRMQSSVDLAIPVNAESFFETLKSFGKIFLAELFSEDCTAVTRLAVADATRSGIVGNEFAASGSGPVKAAVENLFRRTVEKGYVNFEDAGAATAVFFCLLIGDIRIKLLMGANIDITDDLIDRRVDFAVNIVRQLGTCRT